MSAASVLARGRALAETLMVDACTVKRKTGETTDPNSGVVTPTYSTLYTGRCRVQQPNAQARERDVGEAALQMVRFELQLPMSVLGVQADDEVTITAAPLDPDLVGRVFTVRGLSHKTHAVMRRLQVEERTS